LANANTFELPSKSNRKPAKRLRFESGDQQNAREMSHLCNKMARRKRYDACDELELVM